MIPQFDAIIHSCRTKPRAVARKLAAALSPEELARLVERLEQEGAALAEYREMLAEGRRIHQERARPARSQSGWLPERETEARRRGAA